MELVTNIIIGYLKHNKRLVVPQLGAFIVKQPNGEIVFSELMRSDDGVLRSLLVAYGLNELAANGMIDRLRFEVKHAVASGEKFTIANFGEFSSGDNGTIRFKQKREPQTFGGKIKPPIERFEEERLKLQRIQRIRQQQSENITGHSTHRKLRTSQAIAPQSSRQQSDDDDMALGKPDRYLKGLKYENRKGRNQEDDNFGSGRKQKSGSGKMLILLLVVIIMAAVIWFTWQWLNGNNIITAKTEATTTIVEPADTLGTVPDVAPMEDDATTPTPIAQPATGQESYSTPMLRTTWPWLNNYDNSEKH
ncbi:MAG: hypothetical protein J6U59_04325 [Alistipes sp.]|nr:hypothetical protein [Alistipes sp.]